jgi:ribosomal protein S18 acetylase RimI-like enzyme
MTVKVVPGKKKWKKQFIELSLISAPGLFPGLFGPRVEHILEYLYLKGKKNLFSYKNTYFALVDGKPAGLALVYTHEQKSGTWFPMAMDFFSSGGMGMIFQTRYIMKADKRMAPTKKGQSYLCNFGVYPEYRNKGLGTAIMEKACKDAKNKGDTHMVLDVNTDNENAIRFHKRMGFKRMGGPYKVPTRARTFRFFSMKKKL